MGTYVSVLAHGRENRTNTVSSPHSGAGVEGCALLEPMDFLFSVVRCSSRYAPTIPQAIARSNEIAFALLDRRLARTTGSWVHSDMLAKVFWFLPTPHSIQGKFRCTIPVAAVGCTGLAVDSSGSTMAISCGHSLPYSRLYLHDLVQCMHEGEDHQWRTIGTSGDVPGQFNHPARMCCTPTDNLLIADQGNCRIQEFTSAGEFVRCVACVARPWAICCSTGIIAVGTAVVEVLRTSQVLLLNYETGEVLRELAIAKLSGCVTALQFLRGDREIAVMCANMSLQVYSVATGAHERALCVGNTYTSFALTPNDFALSDTGQIILCNYAAHRVLIYDASGTVLLRQFRVVDKDGVMAQPATICVQNGRLYVLDYATPRVFVYE